MLMAPSLVHTSLPHPELTSLFLQLFSDISVKALNTV